jgi:hypothetical protein
MTGSVNTCLIIAGILLVVVLIYYFSGGKHSKEGYSNMNTNAISNLGSLDSSYELVQSPDEVVPATHFADLVNQGNLPSVVEQPLNGRDAIKPVERLNRLHSSQLLPKTSKNVTPYDVDVANTSVYMFAANAPRVSLKDRLYMSADPYRGDIAITYDPEVCLVSKSQYGRDSLRYAALFNPGFQAMYQRNTGVGYKNMPIHVAAKGTLMDGAY